MKRAAIIGCGDVSSVHFEAIRSLKDIELVAVCDTDAGRLKEASASHSIVGFSDVQEMIAQTKPDVVHVCTPHDQHARIAIQCLEQGIHVLTEKPLAHTRLAAQQLLEAERESTAKLGVCFQNRYNPTSQTLHRVLREERYGRVLGASATVLWHRTADYYLNRPWRGSWSGGGGGLLMNQAIHTVDLLQWLIGEVQEVRGRASTRSLGAVIEVEDTAEFAATHAGGASSVFFATLGHAHNAPVALEIVTETAVLSLEAELTVRHPDGRVEHLASNNSATSGRDYWGASHALLIADFYASLDAPEPFWINASEAVKSLDVVKEIYRQSEYDFEISG
ncbi:Gfo/Idh/MocA family protein [Glutamicibacter sp. NPDC087344]|uniref:Gfo/Idh/MocA family protein n=1 Tax=Glutamicibacter sp. NPDC087344 TaxID=3363994 RepID=UPI00381BEB2D